MSSVGQGVGMVVGGAIGFFAGGNVMLGASIGGAIGGYIDPPKGQNTVGPQLEDRTVQTSTYGADIPTFDGTDGMSGNVFWLEGDEVNEHKKTKKVGGKGGATSKQTTFSYSATFAIGFARRPSKPIAGIRRLWLGNQLVYDAGSDNLQSIIASNLQAGLLFKVYDGSDDQQPDPRMQADKGAANVSGYPGLFYIVFYDLDLTEKYNNTLLATQAKVEAVGDGDVVAQSAKAFDAPDMGIDYFVTSSVINPVQIDYAVVRVRNSFDGYFFGYDIWQARLGEYVRKISSNDHEIPVTYGRTSVSSLFISHNFDNRPHVVLWQGQYLDYTGRFTLIDSGYLDTEWFESSSIAYGQITVAACADNETFLASSLSSSLLYKLDGVLLASSSSIGIKVRGLYLSENRLFALHYAGSTSSTTVSIFSRSDLSLIASYTQPVNGVYGVLDVVSDNAFFLMTGANVSYWENGVATDLGACGHAPSGSYEYRWGKVYSAPDYYVQFDPESGGNWAMSGYISRARLLQNVTKLHDVIIAQCARVGLASTDLDLAELVNSDVRGNLSPGVGSPRTVLEQLQAAFPFDVIPSGYKLKFKSRGGAPVLTIPEADLGAHAGGEVPTRFSTALEMPTQIPARVAIKFMNADREYDPDEQDSAFTAQDVDRTYTVSLPLVMTPTEAKRAADVLLRKEWAERTGVSPFSLPPEEDYRKLEAADVIDVIAQGRTHTVRLTRVHNLPDGRIEAEGKLTASAAYVSAAQAQNPLVSGQSLVPLAGSSELILLDIPRIVADQDVPGMTIGIYGYTNDWPGAIAFRSDDFGESYSSVISFKEKTEAFRVSGTPASVHHYCIDHLTALTVTPEWVGADLFSITTVQLYALGNLAAYGAHGRWEIVCFKTVVDNGDGTYALRDFLRGRYGSEWAMTLHESGDRLVMLDPDRVDFAGLSLSLLGMEKQWRGVTAGATIDSAEDSLITYGATNLLPLAPICLRGWRDPFSFDYHIEATRRSRWPTALFSGTATPLGESLEQYEAELWDIGFTTRKRVFSGLSSPSINWTKDQQIADFGYESADVGVKLRQVSSIVGGGRWLQNTLSLPLSADPYLGSVVLLMHMDNVALEDVKGHAVSLNGSVSRSAAQSKFGGYSAVFASGGYLSIPYTTDLAFGATDFTIEMFVFVSSYNAALSRLWSPNGALYDGISFGIDSSGHLYCYCSSNNTSWDLVSNANILTVATGGFRNIIFQRRGPNLDCYYEGSRYGISTSLGSTALMTQSLLDHAIGGISGSDNSLYGYVDEIRVTKTARYTGDTITIQSTPFPNP